MPGPYLHLSAMQNVAQRLRNAGYSPAQTTRIDPLSPGMDMRDVGRLLQENPNFASLGAIGPDLFALLPDFRNMGGIPISTFLTQALKFTEDVYNVVDPFITKWEKYLGPISENGSELISRLTGGLSEDVSTVLNDIGTILLQKLEEFVTQQYDWFGLFSLGLNQGYDEQAYLWMDMLHYRKTGQFGRTLWLKAQEAQSDQLRAYALGYLTHVATDVAGHPFVNSIAGGPYRQHWQRHHAIENHCDSAWYLEDWAAGAPRTIPGYSEFTKSALYFDIAFNEDGTRKTRPAFPSGKTLREAWERRVLLDTDSDLPESIQDLLTQAIQAVYYDPPGAKHPKIFASDGKPSKEQIAEAYRLFFRYLKVTTVDGFDLDPPELPLIWGNLDFPTPTAPSADSSPDEESNSTWEDIFGILLAIANAILYVLEVVAWIITLPWAALMDLLMYPARSLIYIAFERPLYHVIKDFRAVLVLTGYAAPTQDEIDLGLIRIGTTRADSFDQVRAEMGDVFGALGSASPGEGVVRFQDPAYPHFNAVDLEGRDPEYRHPWQYPQTPTEEKPTTAAPYPSGADPSVLYRAEVDPDPGLRDAYETSQSPEQTESYAPQLTPQRHLGDAVTLSEYFLWLATRENSCEIPDYNLDGDRGYAHRSWDWDRGCEGNQQSADPENNSFVNPCTWPSQSSAPASMDTALKLHYVEATNGACSQPPDGPN